MNSPIQQSARRLLRPLLIVLFIAVFYVPLEAQQKPPRPISITVNKQYDLVFGTFCAGDGTGTTIIINPLTGERTKTGNIILLNSFISTARYDVSALPGTFISLIFIDSELTGPNGAKMTLIVGGSNPSSPFVATGEHTTVDIGGTLVVGSAAATPSGAFIGTFYVNFIQE